ncbi:hypothetical protein FOZ63_021631, partial [Perkinsus olseni]
VRRLIIIIIIITSNSSNSSSSSLRDCTGPRRPVRAVMGVMRLGVDCRVLSREASNRCTSHHRLESACTVAAVM